MEELARLGPSRICFSNHLHLDVALVMHMNPLLPSETSFEPPVSYESQPRVWCMHL